jgi:hypothetical protein
VRLFATPNLDLYLDSVLDQCHQGIEPFVAEVPYLIHGGAIWAGGRRHRNLEEGLGPAVLVLCQLSGQVHEAKDFERSARSSRQNCPAVEVQGEQDLALLSHFRLTNWTIAFVAFASFVPVRHW